MTSVPEAEEAGPALIGTILGGRYKIEALVGTGGMGAVYRAEHVHMRKAVAVKVLHREMTLFPEVVARFEREAVAAGRIEHPHVATATDFGRLEDGSFYMVLEFVEGQSLSALIKSHGALPEARALLIARQIADALSAAHAANIVHRDLKPENVMLVEREGRSDLVKVLDFGIAKVQLGSTGEQALTQLGTVFGTPEYMAPEQAQGMSVDHRADLYAVGLILYEMLSGTSPFRHDELVVMLTRQITMEAPPLPESISVGARELVSTLLKKDPTERVQTALDLRNFLDHLMNEASSSSGVLKVAGPSRAAVVEEALRPLPEPSVDVAHAHTALALPSAKTSIASFFAVVRKVGLNRPIAVAGYAVPLGALAAFTGVLLVIGLLTAILFAVSGSDGRTTSSPEDAAPPEPDVLALVAKAETGDQTAIAVLAGRKRSERTPIEWRALGHGYFRIGDMKAGLAIHADGVRANPELARDPIVLGDVRRAVSHPELAVSALELAATALGAAGADLLYDVWNEQKSATNSVVAKKARALLEEEPATSARSAALSAVLNLQAALKKPKCNELKKLLPELAGVADERSVPSLARLTERRGCGFLGLSDCYSCLRANKDLATAVAAAKARPRPNFAGASDPALAPSTQNRVVPASSKPSK